MEKSDLKLRVLPFIYVGILLILGYVFIISIIKINENRKEDILSEENLEETIDFPLEENIEENSEGIIDDGSSNTVPAIEENENKTNNNQTPSKEVAVEKIRLNKSSTALYIGGVETLYASLEPKNVTNKSVSWSSSNTKVVTVDGGRIRAISSGSANITVKSNNGATATCKVTVYGKRVAVKSISLNRSSATIATGSTIILRATINPSNATNQNITWSSSNTGVASVSSTGRVKGIKPGYSVIRATTVDGKRIAEATITVKSSSISTKYVPVTRISLNKSTSTLNIGTSMTLKAIITPSNASNKKITWSSSNSRVATVNSSGVVTGKALGSAKITAKSSDGSKTATAIVTVTKKSVRVNSITVSSTGKVTGKKAGTVTITATARDGSGKKGSARVTVVK